MDDRTLLQEFARHGSEAAFATLVSRHIPFVYSAALRQVNDPDLAAEVTQAVFIILANKAGRLGANTILSGWLFKTIRFVAMAQCRSAARRRQYEHKAHMHSEAQRNPPDPLWEQLSPVLDEALAHLGERDRQAILLRFFEDKSMAEVSQSLGTGEDAARMRIHRALGKLHRYFLRRGISSTTAVIAGALSANAVHAEPAALADSVIVIAAAKGAAASGSTLTLIQGAFKLMAWTKAKMVAVMVVGAVLATGTATIAVRRIQEHRIYSHAWQVREITTDAGLLDRIRPLIQIVPTRFSRARSVQEGVGIRRTNGDKSAGLNQSISQILMLAYDGSTAERLLGAAELPRGGYDFISTLPGNPKTALQQELKNQFGVIARHETVMTNVLLLKIRDRNASGLRAGSGRAESNSADKDRITAVNSTLAPLAWYLETTYFKLPVIDQTGLTDRFDYDLKWQARDWQHLNLEGLKQALMDQLGLELVAASQPVEMVVVKKAN